MKKFFILGAARSGISAARLIKKHGFPVFISELKIIPEDTRAILNCENIPFEHNGHDLSNLKNFDVLVVSPGIPLSAECVKQAQTHGLQIISEIELALQFLNPKTRLIGITGTNGKSTTTHYLAHLLNAHHITAAACGNIGIPLSEVIRIKNDYEALSLELSSYQLELGISKCFDATILLNLQNDHLARHQTIENYLKAKWNLILATRDDGLCIMEESVLHMAMKLQLPMPNCSIKTLDQLDIAVSNPCLLGEHNAKNIYAASLAGMHIGVSIKTVIAEWSKDTSSYAPLAHRLEHVFPELDRGNKDITFINDSKATNVESTLVALKSLSKPIHLLLGGEPKGDSYLPITQFIGNKVARIYPFGKAAPLICHELHEFDTFLEKPFCGMLDASKKALENSQSGDIILLSPACSSFDEFTNFEQRGDIFKAWVKEGAYDTRR